MQQKDDPYFNCARCSSFSAPVLADGSEWCRDCGYERSNVLTGHDCGFYDSSLAVKGVLLDDASLNRSQDRQELLRVTDLNELPSHVTEAAFNSFLDIRQKQDLRSTTKRALMAACVYRECIAAGVPRPCRSVQQMFDVPSKKFNEADKLYGLHRSDSAASGGCIPSSVYEHCRILHTSSSAISVQAIAVLERALAECPELQSKHPLKLAASAIVHVCDRGRVALCGASGCKPATCAGCIKFACKNFDIAKPTLLLHLASIRHALESERDAAPPSPGCAAAPATTSPAGCLRQGAHQDGGAVGHARAIGGGVADVAPPIAHDLDQ